MSGLWIAAAGFLSGIISGMGIGGGTVLIPALVRLCALNQQAVQGVNLIYFIPTALIALRTHKKEKTIVKEAALPLVVFGVMGAAAGAFLAVWLDAAILRKCFGTFLACMGVREVFFAGKKKTERKVDEPHIPFQKKPEVSVKKRQR